MNFHVSFQRRLLFESVRTNLALELRVSVALVPYVSSQAMSILVLPVASRTVVEAVIALTRINYCFDT